MERALELAFESVVERYRAPITNMAFRITGNRDDADDVAQEVFIRALDRLAGFESERHLASWLNVVGRNAAFDCVRRAKARAAHRTPAPDRPQPSPEEVVLLGDGASRLRRAVTGLPPRYREALELYYFYDLSYRDISERLGVPMGTVKTLLFRALGKMRGAEDVLSVRNAA